MNRRFTIPFLLLFSLSTAGCGESVHRSEVEAEVDLAETRGWWMAATELEGEVLRPVGQVGSGWLKEGEEASVPLEITGVHRAVVLASCDADCDDLDVRVVTADGRLVGIDEEEDAYPQVEIEAGDSRSLSLKAQMIDCGTGTCAFAYQTLEFEDPAGGTGTCFAVSPDGLLMTALHVVEGATKIGIVFPDGRSGKADIVRLSSDTDLALLRFTGKTPHWLPLGTVQDVRVGQTAFSVGFPQPERMGSEIKYTEGSIASLSGWQEESTLMQVSIPIQPGNSGGPVVSYDGLVLGIVQSSADDAEEHRNLVNYARHAHVAALLMPSQLGLPPPEPATSRQEAIDRAMKAVCQVQVD